MAQVMPEIAKCPVCGSFMEKVYWEDSSYYSFPFVCDMRYFERISSAMELAEALSWKQEVWEATRKPWDFVTVLRERKSIESIYDILDYAELCVKNAEKRVLEVFK